MSACTSQPILEFKSSGDGSTVTGYLSVFGVQDRHGDIVFPGAFLETLAKSAARNTPIPLLFGHDQNEPLGVFSELAEDSFGLKGTAVISGGARRAAEAKQLVRDRAMSGLSFAYTVVKAEPLPGGGRALKAVELLEGSLVSVPSNVAAQVTEMKAALLESARSAETVLRDRLGLSQREAKRFIAGGWQALSQSSAPDPAEVDRILRKITRNQSILK